MPLLVGAVFLSMVADIGERIIFCDRTGPLLKEQQVREADCRICLLMDKVENLVAPCGCDGSLKYAHYDCLEQWSIEARSLTCEICTEIYKQPYKNRLTSALANAESQERWINAYFSLGDGGLWVLSSPDNNGGAFVHWMSLLVIQFLSHNSEDNNN